MEATLVFGPRFQPSSELSGRSSRSYLAWALIAILLSIMGFAIHRYQAATVAIAQELRNDRTLPEALIASHSPSRKEAEALQSALTAYRAGGNAEAVGPILDFLKSHPNSPWQVSLHTNLGLVYYQTGYFSKALDHWAQAWTLGKEAKAVEERAIAERAFGELVRMHARLGHAAELKALLDQLGDRQMGGSASEAIAGAREGLWMMTNNPGVAYLCGPMAVKSLLGLASRPDLSAMSRIDAVRSSPNGVGFDRVIDLASDLRLPYVGVFRSGNPEIPVPAVVHWKVNHYAAIVGKANNRYRIKDPTFGRDLWLSAEAIRAESSGYFLMAAADAGAGWRRVDRAEAARVRGMGYTNSLDPDHTSPSDSSDCGGGCIPTGNKGMPEYSVHSMLVSLHLGDIPVGYTPPKGPAINFEMAYNQREANQPANPTYSNLGPKWTFHWLSYVQDDPTQPGASVSLAIPGGGTEHYSGYQSGTGGFTPESRLGAELVRRVAPDASVYYERRFSDGSIHTYRQSDGAVFYPRRVFLSEQRDPAGNTVTLTYDAQTRLTAVQDALGQVTTLAYTDLAYPKQITRVTDPFGRYASITYDSMGRLDSVTDALGMTSGFGYLAGGTFINSLMTLYGTTTFDYDDTSGTSRWLEITDPLGRKERVETLHQAAGIPASESVVPTGVATFNSYLDGRNSFYWDKDAYAQGAGDYTKARLKHWLHDRDNTNVTAGVLESTKVPGENRVWLNYPGQTWAGSTGDSDKPSAVARVLDDGSTQVFRTEYNRLGRVTKTIDPVGREEVYEYDTNEIDLLRKKRKNGASYDLLDQYTYNGQHAPLTYIDDAGQLTSYTYNSAGQITSATNALGQTTSYEYDSSGYLLRIRNATTAIQQSFTYDAIGRVRTTTDSEGYVLTYDYDALDRKTRVTYPDGTYEGYTYDKLDLVEVRDRAGRITRYTYNAVRQLTQVNEPLPRILRMVWSPSGRQTALFDGKNQPIRWEYDIAGRRTAEVYADNKRTRYFYDLAGRLKQTTDARNQNKFRYYALDDRVSRLTYSNAPAVTFTYDAVHPRLVSMADGIGTTTWAYGAIGLPGAQQVIREDGPYAQWDVIAYTYDALGRRASRRFGATYTNGSLTDGQTETYTYDALGRLARKVNAVGDFSFGYLGQTSQLSQRTTAAYSTFNTPALLLSYDSNLHDRRLTRIRYAATPAAAPADLLQDYAYQYDVLGRLIRSEETGYGSGGSVASHKVWDLVYDGADRLETYAPATGNGPGTAWYEYDYDPADNRTAASLNGSAQTIAYNTVNQATTVNTQAYTYDAAGNLANDGVYTYTWDSENRLTQAQEATAPTPVAKTYHFSYDGLGRLLYKWMGYGTSPSVVSNDRYLWCDAAICEARTGSGFATVTGSWFDEGGRTLTSNVPAIFFKDQLGSVRQARPRDGATPQTLEFGPYGELVAGSGAVSTYSGPRYAGMFFDREMGRYFTPYRSYSPMLGRWMTRDPIGVDGGINTYAYVDQNPLMYRDLLGLQKGFSPGRGGNSSQRRQATREFTNSAADQPPPELGLKRPGPEDPMPPPSNPSGLSDFEAYCRLTDVGLPVCGPGPKFRIKCLAAECLDPNDPGFCTADNPSGSRWRPALIGSDFDFRTRPDCRCIRWVPYDKY